MCDTDSRLTRTRDRPAKDARYRPPTVLTAYLARTAPQGGCVGPQEITQDPRDHKTQESDCWPLQTGDCVRRSHTAYSALHSHRPL